MARPDSLTRSAPSTPPSRARARSSSSQELWALERFNPQVNAQGGLSAFPAGAEGTTFEYVFLEHDAAQGLLTGKSGVLSRDY